MSKILLIKDRYYATDPVFLVRRLPDRFKEPGAFLASVFALGRMELITSFLSQLFDEIILLEPAELLLWKNDSGLYYRFFSAQMVETIVNFCGFLYDYYGSIERAFLELGGTESICLGISGISNCFKDFVNIYTKELFDKRLISMAFPDPKRGSACKRMCLFLRWMVRDQYPDIGLWSRIKPKDLVVPLDVHILDYAFQKGIISSKNSSWKKALKITDYFRQLNPKDPLFREMKVCHMIKQKKEGLIRN